MNFIFVQHNNQFHAFISEKYAYARKFNLSAICESIFCKIKCIQINRCKPIFDKRNDEKCKWMDF